MSDEDEYSRADPRRFSGGQQRAFRPRDEEGKLKTKERWPERSHSEPALHDLVMEQKYETDLGYAGNLRLFVSKIEHPMGRFVLKCPTFRDMMWYYKTNATDTFSKSMYDAIMMNRIAGPG